MHRKDWKVRAEAVVGYRDENDNLVGMGGWLAALRPHAGVRLLLCERDSPFRRQIADLMEQRGHQVCVVNDPTEALYQGEQQRFEVALIILPPQGVPELMQQLRDQDPDLEVVWMSPVPRVADVEKAVTKAAERAKRRLTDLQVAARRLLAPLTPEAAVGWLLEQGREVIGGQVHLCPHQPLEPQQPLISPDRRRLRVPLWESGPLPDEPQGHGEQEDSGYRLEFIRSDDDVELSRADVERAAILGCLGSLALTRAHCEQALSDLYKEMEQGAAQPRAANGTSEDLLAGRGLTSGAIGPLERLAGVLAHELNNPLTFVLANLSCMEEELVRMREILEELPDGARALAQWDELREVLSEAMVGAGRVREVVLDLTTLGARTDGEDGRRPVAVEDVVRAALRIARREISRRARVVVDLEPGLPCVVGSESRLGQVLLNLLLNAVQAVPPGNPGLHEVRIRAFHRGPHVAIGISDTGTGISPDTLPRVFDAGYTTKPVGEGSGLGLAISKEIVHTYGGDIQIQSRPGVGTTVTVLLPVHHTSHVLYAKPS